MSALIGCKMHDSYCFYENFCFDLERERGHFFYRSLVINLIESWIDSVCAISAIRILNAWGKYKSDRIDWTTHNSSRRLFKIAFRDMIVFWELLYWRLQKNVMQYSHDLQKREFLKIWNWAEFREAFRKKYRLMEKLQFFIWLLIFGVFFIKRYFIRQFPHNEASYAKKSSKALNNKQLFH